MGFVKVQKNNAYFKRYQVKYRRRREGKTDYLQRRLLVTQAKNKYQAAKYRLVARVSNKHVTCQIISAELKGDRTHASAYSHELKDYGVKVGLANYAACYATGLLLARRILTLKKLDKKYEGVKECTGEHFQFDDKKYKKADGARPFKAFLDIGLARPTIGNRVFACLKGAVDGGLNVPHNDKRFPGYNPSTGSLDAETHRSRIMGAHVGEWMEEMQEEDPDKYKIHFSRYIAEGLEEVDALEEMYEKCHAEIRKNPKARNPVENAAAKKKKKADDKKPRSYKLKANRPYNLAQRKYRATQKVNAVRRRLGMENRKP